MSTGDQTQYVRSKLAERGTRPGARFMRDGFDAWAESETPARAGQMEKEPAEMQMANYGGAMTLKHAKKIHLNMRAMDDYSDHSMHGGADIIPEPVKKAVEEAKKLVNMWRSVSSWIDSFEADLRDEIIENPKSQPNLVAFAKQLETMLNNVKAFKTILDGVAAALGAVGLGRHGGRRLHGGMSLQDVGKYARQIAQIYMWFKNNKPNLEQVLKLKSLQPYGQQVLDAVLPIFSAIGLGHHGGVHAIEWDPCATRAFGECVGGPKYGGAICNCEHDDSMHGGASCPPGFRDDGLTCFKDAKCSPPKRHAKKWGTKCPPGQRDDGLACWQDAHCTKPEMLPKHGGRVGGSYSPEDAAYAAAAAYNKKGKSEVMGGRKPSARGAIVKQVMHEHGLSLPQASKYVKEHGLY